MVKVNRVFRFIGPVTTKKGVEEFLNKFVTNPKDLLEFEYPVPFYDLAKTELLSYQVVPLPMTRWGASYIPPPEQFSIMLEFTLVERKEEE